MRLINCAKSHDRRGLGCALLLGCLLTPVAVAAQTPQQGLAAMDWSVKAPHDLAHNPPSEKAVRSFIGNMTNSVGSITNQVCNVQFADLKHNGTLSLVLGDDGGGTADCNYTEIFDKNAESIEEYFLDAYIGTPGVEDINGDGRFEVVVDEFDGAEFQDAAKLYHGSGIAHCDICAACNEYWPRVYAWTGSGYTEVSSQYPKYYERELQSLKKQIAAIDASEAAAQRRRSAVPSPVQPAPGVFRTQQWSATFNGGAEVNQTQETGPEPSATATPAPEAAETPDPGAVSYTHLDVYKRQAVCRANRGYGGDTVRMADRGADIGVRGAGVLGDAPARGRRGRAGEPGGVIRLTGCLLYTSRCV